MINIKTKEEIQIMREGGKMLSEIPNKLSEVVKPGITTNDLENLAQELIKQYDVEPSFLGYNNHPAVLCTSINEEIVHGIPSDRVLKDGDVLKIDVGIKHKGFHTDTATTVIVGKNDDPIKNKLLNVTKEALRIGISKAKAGNTLGDIGSAIQEYVESNGFNVVRDLVGHGIGRNLHEEPQVPNYGNLGEGMELKPGMTIAIEPMVVTGNWKVKEKDGVFLTKDKGLAAHFEHTIAITENGTLILTE